MKKNAMRLLFGFCSLYFFVSTVFAADRLVPVGQVIGLELFNDTVTVVAFDDSIPSGRDGGLQIGDQISRIDGHTVETAEDVRRALNCSDGSVDVTVLRGGRERQLQLQPRITTEGPKLGVFLRQGITGIGTVTWYDPETDSFATLGHAVNDGKGKLLQMSRGNAHPATVISVQKGKAGAPGQLKGALNTDVRLGQLTGNTNCGVFGKAPKCWEGEAIPVGSAEDVKAGHATIRSTVSDGAPQDYSVEILKVYPQSRSDGRNMLIKVTDPDLLAATGGIVQGMSGSPIIQDGKLIGAVTHVLVNDPTTGYGIFIENMLNAAA